MSRSFAQIELTLPHSKKFRQLKHTQRFAYLCAHLSPLGNYIGLFRYPIAVWADDVEISTSELEVAIERMVEVGLISYDHDENYVRIIGWFLKKNRPENASRMASYAADFEGLGCSSEMVMESAVEFAVGSIGRAVRWKKNSTEWGKLREVFNPFLAIMRQNFGDDFHKALSAQLVGQQRAVKAELCAIMPSLQSYLEAPCPHPATKVGAYETKTRRDGNEMNTKKDEMYTARVSTEKPQGEMLPKEAQVENAEKPWQSGGPRQETVDTVSGEGRSR